MDELEEMRRTDAAEILAGLICAREEEEDDDDTNGLIITYTTDRIFDRIKNTWQFLCPDTTLLHQWDGLTIFALMQLMTKYPTYVHVVCGPSADKVLRDKNAYALKSVFDSGIIQWTSIRNKLYQKFTGGLIIMSSGWIVPESLLQTNVDVL